MKLPSLTLGKKKNKMPDSMKQDMAKQSGQINAQNMPPSAVSRDPMQKRKPSEVLAEGMINVRDIIAPPAIEVDFNYTKVGNKYYRTLFVAGYPRFVGANWLSPVINFEHSLDISMFYYPVESKGVLEDLRKKITEMEATMMSNQEKGLINDPTVSIALDDAKALQEQLVKGVEKFFQFSFYITIPADTLDELEDTTKKLESTLGSLLLISKNATLQMEEAFQSTIPTGMDKLLITRNMDTTSLATTFPFTSSDLTSDEGIMYGINRHNGSLVVFDRFSLENANSVVFAKSGSGKSYYVKLEALRLMVFGADVFIIDPESEYKTLCEAVGGNFINFSANSPDKINPFDLSGIASEGENELGQKLLSLHTLFKLMLGSLTPTEEAILDRALIETYRIKGITTEPETQIKQEPPVMEDLYKVLRGAEEKEARGMAERLEKYIRGSLAGIFDAQSTVDINNKMIVFSTQNLEDVIKPIAYYIILDFIWTRIKKDLKRRILIVEEAWSLLQDDDSARFIYGVAKRCRKYYLGLTTISQDVDDFLSSDFGKAIVTNSSIQVLLKQHPAAIERVAETFYLSEGEKRLLLAANIGEGLFFAGANHVSIKIKASEKEHRLITTDPQEILRMRKEKELEQTSPQNNSATPTLQNNINTPPQNISANQDPQQQAMQQQTIQQEPAVSPFLEPEKMEANVPHKIENGQQNRNASSQTTPPTQESTQPEDLNNQILQSVREASKQSKQDASTAVEEAITRTPAPPPGEPVLEAPKELPTQTIGRPVRSDADTDKHHIQYGEKKDLNDDLNLELDLR